MYSAQRTMSLRALIRGHFIAVAVIFVRYLLIDLTNNVPVISGTFFMFYRYFLKIVCRAIMASRLPPSAASRRYFSARAISLFTPKPLK